MITTTQDLKIQQYSNCVNFMRNDNMVAQLIVKKYELQDGKSGVCLYSVIGDKECYIRTQIPTVEVVDNKIVLVDCHHNSQFNIALDCESEDQARAFAAKLTQIVQGLWKYRNHEIAKIYKLQNKSGELKSKPNKANKKPAKEKKDQAPKGDTPTNSVNLSKLIQLPTNLEKHLSNLTKLVRSNKLIMNTTDGVGLSIRGNNTILGLVEFYENLNGIKSAPVKIVAEHVEVTAETPAEPAPEPQPEATAESTSEVPAPETTDDQTGPAEAPIVGATMDTI